jgi:hypothetical protein
MAPAVMPLASAMAGIVTPLKPWSANNRSAWARMRSRVALPPRFWRAGFALVVVSVGISTP